MSASDPPGDTPPRRLASLSAVFGGGGSKSPTPNSAAAATTTPVAVGSIRSRATTFATPPPSATATAAAASPVIKVTPAAAPSTPVATTTTTAAATPSSSWDATPTRGRSVTASPAASVTPTPSYGRPSMSGGTPKPTTLQASSVSSPFVVAGTRSPSPSVSAAPDEPEKEPEKEVVFTSDMEYVRNPNHLDGVGDMCGLMYLEVPNILHNLAVRYERNEIYTNINKVLIAVNPYQFIDIYHSGVIRDYRARALKRHTDLLPHVFTVAQGAYHNLFRTLTNQSLIVCGESGSGKTESAKHLMRYLASSEIEQSPPADGETAAAVDVKDDSKSSSHAGVSIEKQVLDCNPILEAFGNAKTVLNNNSSRFGKFTKLVFAAKERKIKGSFIETYLLEKSRLVQQEKGERNYHVFYQLCSKALPEAFASVLQLSAGANSFHYLNQSGTIEVDGMSDGDNLSVLLSALSSIGMDTPLQLELFRIVSGILHLGNINFKAITNDSCEIAAPATGAVDSLNAAAELLGVDKTLLGKRLTTRSIVVPINQTIIKPLAVSDAEAGRDTMTKALYNSLFGWIVRSMNKTLFTAGAVGAGASAATGTTIITADGESKEMLWIGILDVFGFERFENNSFEQLCINFANERLQQFFNIYILQSEQTEYLIEAIFWTPLTIPSNADVLDLISGATTGIMAVLDSSCRTPKATDRSFTADLFSFHRKHPRIKQINRVPLPAAKGGGFANINGFSIRHYANTVIYNAKEFLPKNNDSTHPDTTSLFGGSTNSVTKQLFEIESTDSKGRKPVGAQFRSVGNVFITQLAALMVLLNQTTPFFVRCVKPNNMKKPANFSWQYVHPQLQCGGIVEALRILKLGYPSRCTYGVIHQRYGSILTPEPPDLNRRDFCEAVLAILGEGKVEKKDYQLGLTKVFFRAGKQAFMEELLQSDSKLPEVTVKRIKRFLRNKRMQRARAAIRVHIRFAIRLRRMRARVRIYRFAGVVRVVNRVLIRRWKRIRRKNAAVVLQSYIGMQIAVRAHRKAIAFKNWCWAAGVFQVARRALLKPLRKMRRDTGALVLQSYIESHAKERALLHVKKCAVRISLWYRHQHRARALRAAIRARMAATRERLKKEREQKAKELKERAEREAADSRLRVEREAREREERRQQMEKERVEREAKAAAIAAAREKAAAEELAKQQKIKADADAAAAAEAAARKEAEEKNAPPPRSDKKGSGKAASGKPKKAVAAAAAAKRDDDDGDDQSGEEVDDAEADEGEDDATPQASVRRASTTAGGRKKKLRIPPDDLIDRLKAGAVFVLTVEPTARGGGAAPTAPAPAIRCWFRMTATGTALSWTEAPDGDTATGVTLETSERNTIELIDVNRIQLQVVDATPAAAKDSNESAPAASTDPTAAPSVAAPAPVVAAGGKSLVITCDDRRVVLAVPAAAAAASAGGKKKSAAAAAARTATLIDDWYVSLRYAHRNLSMHNNPSVPIESENASDERGNAFVASLWNRIEDLERERKSSASATQSSGGSAGGDEKQFSSEQHASLVARNRELEARIAELTANGGSTASSAEPSTASVSSDAESKSAAGVAVVNGEDGKALSVPGARARRSSGIRADTISGLLPVPDASDRAIIERNLFRQKTFAILSADPDVMKQKVLQEKKARELIAKCTHVKQSRSRDIEAAASHIAENERIMDSGDELIAQIQADTKSEAFMKSYGHMPPAALEQLRVRTHDEVERAKMVVGQWTKVREEARAAVKEADRIIREKEQLLLLAQQAAAEREAQLVNQNSKALLPDFDRGREFFCMTTAAILHKLQLRGILDDSRKEAWAFSLFDIAILEGVPFHEWNEWVMERVIAMKRDKDRQRTEQALIEQRQRDTERARLAALEHELQERKRSELAMRSGPMTLHAAGAGGDDHSTDGSGGRARSVSGINGTVVKIVNPADVRAAVPLDLSGGRAASRSVFAGFGPNSHRPASASSAAGPSAAESPKFGPTAGPTAGPSASGGSTAAGPPPFNHQLSAGSLQAQMSAQKKKQEEGCVIA